MFWPPACGSLACGIRVCILSIEMTNGIEDQLNLMNSASTGVKTLGDTHGVTTDQINAQGNAEAQKAMQDLITRQNQELMQPDPNTTIGQPGEKVVIGPARNILIMPQMNDDHPSCYSESWWTRHLAPIPRFELHHDRILKPGPIGLSERDTKYPPSVSNFPIHPDRMMGYRAFLS